MKPTPERYCKQCGKRMERRRSVGGRLESIPAFEKRQFCCRKCQARWQADNLPHPKPDQSKWTKPSPEKYCAYCGERMYRKRINGRLEDYGVFLRRKYCSQECMSKGFVKTDAADQRYRCAHHSATKIAYDREGMERSCQICGSVQNVDVHHRDGNFRNNHPDNLMTLCRSCHIKIHRNPNFKKQYDSTD